jgi:Phasin protein
MTKAAQFPFNLPEGFPNFSGTAKESLESMSKAYSEWLHNANRVQAEVIRFVGERFSKDVDLISRFSACKQPDEFMRLQAEALSELTSDYMQEGARIFGLFSEVSRETLGDIAKAASSKRSG